jgi:hypothetical protein
LLTGQTAVTACKITQRGRITAEPDWASEAPRAQTHAQGAARLKGHLGR